MDDFLILLMPLVGSVAAVFGGFWLARKKHPLKTVENRKLEVVRVDDVAELAEVAVSDGLVRVEIEKASMPKKMRGIRFRAFGRRAIQPTYLIIETSERRDRAKA